ncbi:MAG: IclR family transcriptional regulator [Candidatus Accumulibacter sp.]|jgi:DNA-binding IclR family transcriptional regulator|nr:IclR family transcriptional regulator [Accumulibacter sp.]
MPGNKHINQDRRSAGDGQKGEKGVRSLQRALTLLRIVAREGGNGGLGLVALSRLAGLHKTTVYRLASVLVTEGFLVRNPETDCYRLGLAVLDLGSSYLGNLTLRQEALPYINDLMKEADETVHLGVRDGNAVIYIEKVQAPANVIAHTRIGQRESVHVTALGKALLAFSDPADVEEVIAGGLPARTKHTVTVPAQFRAVLEEVRRNGYAINLEENHEHINAVAAPIFDHSGKPIAGIVVSGLVQRLPLARLRELGERTKVAATAISRQMGYICGDHT